MARVLSIDIGSANLACCLIDGAKNIRVWEVLSIGGTAGSDACAQRVADAFDARFTEFASADLVVIERQSMINGSMRMMQAYVHMYFIMRGKEVRIVATKNAFLGVSNGGGKAGYRARKKAAVEYALEFVRTGRQQPAAQHLVAAFLAAKKKDDLADALVQALAHLSD
jgi:hypothetical protein